MNKTKEWFELLKDLPNVNKGAILILSNSGYSYITADKNNCIATFSPKLVRSNPTWFKEIVTEPKEDKSVFNHKRIHDRIQELQEQEDAFNAARESTGIIIGRGEYNDGDCVDLYDNKYKTFQDYQQSKLSPLPSTTNSKEEVKKEPFWTDELVMEIVGKAHRDGYNEQTLGLFDRVQNFKKSKLNQQ